MKIRALVPVIILSLLHAYIGFRLLPDLAAGAAIRESGAAALLASCALMLAGLMARSIETRTLADRLAAVGLFFYALVGHVPYLLIHGGLEPGRDRELRRRLRAIR